MGKLSVVGKKRLEGTTFASGAKNAALPILAATVLAQGESILTNIPDLMDVQTMIKMLRSLGIRTEFIAANTIRVVNDQKVRHIAPYELVTAMRASFFVAGPLLARTGLAKVPMPGGCAIGARPIDIHLKGFQSMGAEVRVQHGFVELKARQLQGANIYLSFPSVGATENIMMAACLAKGTTVIENAALEPEITDLGQYLIRCGAEIEGLNSTRITIHGKEMLSGCQYDIIPDRVEAGTLLIAAAITGGDITVEKVCLKHLRSLLRKLKECGVEIYEGTNHVRVVGSAELQAIDIETAPYPGFPTDMQAQMMALLSITKGRCVVKESIFENRFMHAEELIRMGAQIKFDKNTAFITGVTTLSSAEVRISDLRAGAALVLAGLAAEGETLIHGLRHLKRGYDGFIEKLQALGASINESKV